MKKILVTGGAGFIGSHLVDKLINEGHEVTVIDSLEEQVHHGKIPEYINKSCRYIWGSCLDRELLSREIKKANVIYHLAALVGVGQSMYEVERYTKTNSYATSILLEEVINLRDKIEKIIVASSMSIYGEGAYVDEDNDFYYPKLRSEKQLRKFEWDFYEKNSTIPLKPIPTFEDKPLFPTSIYAIGKRDQEEMFHVIGNTYGIPSVAFRFFNVYGSRQDLNNPYTGVAAIFSSRLLRGQSPAIFEDGNQSRDFVHISDIVNGLYLGLTNPNANFETFNIGSGHQITINRVAELLSKYISQGKIKPVYLNQFRFGDIRHCFADISKAERLIGYKPQYKLEDGIEELINWVKAQTLLNDKFDDALNYSKQIGIVK